MLRRSALPFGLVLLAAAAPVPAADTRIVAWGDSITFGDFDGTDEDDQCTEGVSSSNPSEECGYVGRVGPRLNNSSIFTPTYLAEFMNLGKNGESAAAALSRLDRTAWTCPCTAAASPCPTNSLKYWYCNGYLQPEDLFVLMEGTNDVTNGISSESIKASLEALGDKAEALGLNVVALALTPRHPEAWTSNWICTNGGGESRLQALNDKLEILAEERGWPFADVHSRLSELGSSLFTVYYQNWVPMRCDGGVDGGSSGKDPVGHPDRGGIDYMSSDASFTDPSYHKTVEAGIRSALPARLLLDLPQAPLAPGSELSFSVTLCDGSANCSAPTLDRSHELTWDFGDGNVVVESASGSPVLRVHSYAAEGNYDVTVTIEHPNGGQRSTSALLQVSNGDEVFLDGFESGDTSAWIEGSDSGEE